MQHRAKKWLELNDILKLEADKILHSHGLLDLLNKYGKPYLTGSYILNTMAWRDLDFNLAIRNCDLAEFLELGKEIGIRLKPHKMNYRNELIKKRAGFPDGMYWGIYTNLDLPETWKIDLWVFEPHQVKEFIRFSDELGQSISDYHRSYLIEIKYFVSRHPGYFTQFKSLDVYDAVIKSGVRSVEEFQLWLKDKKNVSVTFDNYIEFK